MEQNAALVRGLPLAQLRRIHTQQQGIIDRLTPDAPVLSTGAIVVAGPLLEAHFLRDAAWCEAWRQSGQPARAWDPLGLPYFGSGTSDGSLPEDP